jgi:hypothetical protein
MMVIGCETLLRVCAGHITEYPRRSGYGTNETLASR